MLFIAALMLFLGYWALPATPAGKDAPRWLAYPILLVLLGLTAFYRLYWADQAMGRYWDDPAICIIDPCNIVELHVFRIDFAIGHREPLYPWIAAGVWWLFPQMKALVVERLTSTLFDVAAGWLFYRLGREVTGLRLTGLILAALGAFSKPMILQNLGGMPGLTLPFIVALILWFQFRLFRKSNLSHFLQWGFALGFGYYTYIAYRPWMLFLAFISLVWIVFRPKGEDQAPLKSSRPAPGLTPAIHWTLKLVSILGMAGLFLFLLDRMFVVFFDNPISKLWRMNLWVWLLIQILLFGALGYFYSKAKGKEKLWVGWCLGVLLVGFLVYPLAMNEEIGIKIQDNRIHFHNLHEVLAQIANTIRTFFYTGDDRADMNVEGDPFFDYHAAVLVFAGLIFVLARPSWKKCLLVLAACVGTVGHVMTVDPTSAKILGALPPLLLLSSWGLASWVSASWTGTWNKKGMGILVLAALTAFWVWEGKGTFERVYVKWWDLFQPDILVSKEISAQLPTKRVYMGLYNGLGFASPQVEGVIHDGEPIYILEDTNVINLMPGEQCKDLAVLISGMDGHWTSILKKDFPRAQWTPHYEYWQNPGDIPNLYDVVIPASDIPKKQGKLFMAREVPDAKWLRRVYETTYGLGRGMIQYEDLSPTLNPLPPGKGAHSASAEGQWVAPEDGDYVFSVTSPNPIQIWLDGRKALTSIFSETTAVKTVSSTLHLTKGPHLIRYLSFLRSNAWYDRVNIQERHSGFKEALGP